jgi:hypothetical protein
MPNCLVCDQPVRGGSFRLSIGAVDYDSYDGLDFNPEPFRDGELFKYLCAECGGSHGVYVEELELDVCRVINPDLDDSCDLQFESASSPRCDQVIQIEWGELETFKKGPGMTRVKFTPQLEGRVHEQCAIEHWRLDLCCRGEGLADVPPAYDL